MRDRLMVGRRPLKPRIMVRAHVSQDNIVIKFSMNPDLTNYWNFKNKEYRFDIYMSDDFSDVKDIKQVYTIVLSKDKKNMLVVYNKGGIWILPGGGVEEGETLIDTLVREVKEETNRDIDMNTIRSFFYQKSYKKDSNGEWKYVQTQARYIAVASNDLEFEHDPDHGDIIEAKWIPIENVNEYLNWGTVGEMIKKELPKYIDKIK